MRIVRFYFLFIALVLTGFISGGQAAGQQDGKDSVSELLVKLEREFANSFPKDASPNGTVREFDLVASEGNWGIMPPYQTKVWAYNGQIPGPIFRIKLGESIKVRFINRLPQSTTVHWHGIRVPNAMDGVPGVTQEPIPSGGSFSYQFTPKDAGTFWFHPHVNSAEQIERGLHGVLIVEDPDEPQYSRDLVWVLDDWLLNKTGEIHDKFVTRHDLAHDGRWGNFPTINGTFQLPVSVKAGERIRLRIINVANGRVFVPQFQGLSPIVIAVDGMLTGTPFPLKRFLLAPGNRIDLDITIPRSSENTTFNIIDTYTRKPFPLAYFHIQSGNTSGTPKFKPPQAHHIPQWEEAINAPVLHEYMLDAKEDRSSRITWTIDGNAWPNGKTHELPLGQFSRLRFTNNSYRLHPMHLHGQFFKLIARNGKSVDENYWRDTVLIGPEQSVDIGLVPLDTGKWANHCHILEHAEAGMMSMIWVK